MLVQQVKHTPFFSPFGVVFTNGVSSSSFFFFSALTFFSPAGVFAATLTCLAASLASFSSRFASFFAAGLGQQPAGARFADSTHLRSSSSGLERRLPVAWAFLLPETWLAGGCEGERADREMEDIDAIYASINPHFDVTRA